MCQIIVKISTVINTLWAAAEMSLFYLSSGILTPPMNAWPLSWTFGWKKILFIDLNQTRALHICVRNQVKSFDNLKTPKKGSTFVKLNFVFNRIFLVHEYFRYNERLRVLCSLKFEIFKISTWKWVKGLNTKIVFVRQIFVKIFILWIWRNVEEILWYSISHYFFHILSRCLIIHKINYTVAHVFHVTALEVRLWILDLKVFRIRTCNICK